MKTIDTPIQKLTLEEFVNKFMTEHIGYEFGYSEDAIKALPEYRSDFKHVVAYGAIFGTDEIIEYATTLFIESLDKDNFKATLFIGVEDGLGQNVDAYVETYTNEAKLLNKLIQLHNN